MNLSQRQLILIRDGFQCVSCHGTCDQRGRGEPCKLPSPTLQPAVYFQVEKGYPKQYQMQVHHALKKQHEAWNECASLCKCCHDRAANSNSVVQQRVLAYLKTVGPTPQEYLDAQAAEAEAKPKRRKAKKKARQAAYRKAKAKGGGKLRSTPKPAREAPAPSHGQKPPGMTQKDFEQQCRPVLVSSP